MIKYEWLLKMTDAGVVAVIRADQPEEAVKISEMCIKGGITAIEVAFTTPEADKVIASLIKSDISEEVIIGAGTVLDSETAKLAINAGASFIVSPAFDKDAAKLCNRYQVPYIPGCMTIKEMITAMEYGAPIIKLFPGNHFSSDIVSAIKGPLPQLEMMPTGGVNLNNVEEWILRGCIAVGTGSDLTYPAKTGDYGEISKIASQFVQKAKEAKRRVMVK
ncbi:bifunctional 2-keto-4-hydroxyglutarate aldolase/2-keto-3-deoxy-6-phosphogluconate aldolase [Metabacillus idriensis]|uniref:bifunctional 2-keto-4-hydroxyglutarate aldolase/2-keto-3-deoxy-6-phosphogluconate aldolase n=1 Tax=Metabacillus idriensis TaxID=324768 RepID=UPI00174C9770|nr:bifunctional 2-keto-4-hydroxyglutarate aldolase/2-keto-3-deoxy-6-phosphogluconate aldolase [Metabacillus idriensis]